MGILMELLKGKVVNCLTEEEAKEFLSFLHFYGYRWVDDESLTESLCYKYGESTCYNTNRIPMKVSYSNKKLYQSETGYQIITYQEFKRLINNKNMETKEMKIVPPDGYEVDKENSTFDCIKFKPIKKTLTYEDVAKELFCDRSCYYIDEYAKINICVVGVTEKVSKNPINCTSHKQAEKLLAINKLMNVAKYLNGDWKPDWSLDDREGAYSIGCIDDTIKVFFSHPINMDVYFKTKELAQQAIDILGEETIRLALYNNW